MLRRLTCPWFVNVASSVNNILVKNKSSDCSFHSPHSENPTFRRKSSPWSSWWSDMWYGWNLLVCSISSTLRWLIPPSRLSRLELTCGLWATDAKMSIACRSLVADLSRLCFLLSTFPVSLSVYIKCANVDCECVAQSGYHSAYTRTAVSYSGNIRLK